MSVGLGAIFDVLIDHVVVRGVTECINLDLLPCFVAAQFAGEQTCNGWGHSDRCSGIQK